MSRGTNADAADLSPTDRGLWRNRDFLVPYLAESQSIAGDQIGRVALSILVFDRTGSAAWTALTYALTFLPAILGGIVLGGVGDRFPRVWVMVATDVLRAALFLVVAVRGLPLPVVVGVVAVTFFLGPAFSAAMVSRMAATLVPDRFRTATGIRMVTSQVAQVAGFGAGGIVVAVVHPRAALVINAATFAVSAVLVGALLGHPPRDSARDPDAEPAVLREGSIPEPPPTARLWRDPWLRHLMLLTGLAAFFIVPEGLAVPVAHELGVRSSVTGLLLAAGPLGSAVGAILLVRYVPRRAGLRTARFMAVACGVPLVVTAALPPWPVVIACWAVSGALWAFQVDVATTLVHAVDERVRSTTIARASAVLLGAQGLGLVVFGALASWAGARWGVALAGIAGTVSASGIVLGSYRRSTVQNGPADRHGDEPRLTAH